MLESFNTQHEMQYQRLSADEQQKRGILGRLVGIIADFKNPTRNGRRYTEELWDKTFNDPIMKEKLDNRCVFGELGHPVDRTEIDMENRKVALSMKAIVEDAEKAARAEQAAAEKAEAEAAAEAEAKRLEEERADMAPYIVGSID